MAAKGKRPMRALTAGDKIEAIQRVNDGESKASVARDIGVPESTLRGWCKNEDKLRYMSSRRSTPDTDKSCDGELPDKRARLDASPGEPRADSPADTLDLSAPSDLSRAPDRAVELTRPKAPSPRYDYKDPGANVSMSAISPLSGLTHAHLPPLAQSHLGLSFNDIATNLSLIAQLNPGLGALTGSVSSSKALRSVRSPKPSHGSHHSGGALNLSDKYKSGKSHSDAYGERSRSRTSHHASKEPMDEALWYWLKTQQAMLDLAAAPPAPIPTVPSSKSSKESNGSSLKASVPMTPVNPHMDFNRNTWFWQYYKQFGGALPLPDEKVRSASQVTKESGENILYSHLTKGKAQEPTLLRPEEPAVTSAPPTVSPAAADAGEREARTQSKARTVLDNLLFNNNNVETGDRERGSDAENEWDSGAAAALEHGDKFLQWLEACGDPSVTRMHVHQLRGLMHNLRARRAPAPPAAPPAATTHDRVSRRK